MDILRTYSLEIGRESFTVNIYHDPNMGAPGKEHDGHGIVSDWTSRVKGPGELILHTDGRSRRYYDVQATTKLARRDGWGLGEWDTQELARKLGRTPKPGDIVAESVARDFEYLRAWCNDEWQWVGVEVTHDKTETSDSLWGVEDSASFADETAREMAESILHDIRCTRAKRGRQTRERKYWETRDVQTKGA